ncbi:MAG TPA: hypothetical protein ENN69_02220 [Spirochaetia bacterium]|nr:hypothetical protein [Spirochaetia bacterium]
MTSGKFNGKLLQTLFLLDAGGSTANEINIVTEEETHTADKRTIACALCGASITNRRETIRENGSFEHVLTNPAGVVYRIGCFQNANGCTTGGEETHFFSWFPGYAWRLAHCAACGTHLGWRFSGTHGRRFFALVLDRLAGL